MSALEKVESDMDNAIDSQLDQNSEISTDTWTSKLTESGSSDSEKVEHGACPARNEGKKCN